MTRRSDAERRGCATDETQGTARPASVEVLKGSGRSPLGRFSAPEQGIGRRSPADGVGRQSTRCARSKTPLVPCHAMPRPVPAGRASASGSLQSRADDLLARHGAGATTLVWARDSATCANTSSCPAQPPAPPGRLAGWRRGTARTPPVTIRAQRQHKGYGAAPADCRPTGRKRGRIPIQDGHHAGARSVCTKSGSDPVFVCPARPEIGLRP